MEVFVIARRLFKEKLIYIDDITETIRYIKDSDGRYISENGNVYCDYGNDLFYLKKNYTNPSGYVSCGIKYKSGKIINKRVHKLVANAFLDKIDGNDIVGHLNNIKTDNRVCNLYWTTAKENAQKAHDDGLVINKYGYEDNQSKPILVYDKDMTLLYRFGSISHAAKTLGVPKSTICNQCKNDTENVRKKFIYRYDNNVL